MSDRGRSTSPRPLDTRDGDVDMDNGAANADKPNAKVVVVMNLTRNVFETHLRTIFGFYGEIAKLDLPLYRQSGQNRGRASLEFSDAEAAHKAFSHMNGGQLDGAILKLELSETLIRLRSPSRTRGARNGRSPARSYSRSPSRGARWRRERSPPRGSLRGRGGFGRRGPPGRDNYRPNSPSRSRSRSPYRREHGRLPPRRRSPSYERGGTGRGRRNSRSRSYSDRYSSRSRSRSYSSRSYSRSRTRSRSPRSYSSDSRSSRSRSVSKGRRSYSRDDIRDSRSRSRSASARSMSRG